MSLGTAVSEQEAAVEAKAIAAPRAQELKADELNEVMTHCESLHNELRNYYDLDESYSHQTLSSAHPTAIFSLFVLALPHFSQKP